MDSSPDPHRPHRTTSINSSSSSTATATATTTTATSELFICFTSRLSSSSSMKLPSSKSILSPARARDAPPPTGQISLSSSLSRRLKSNGSLKGGQASPMFPSGGKKRGGAGFENPEPSSPKVTCIGQVRVKTKKQGKKLRTRSKRKGEVSFRKLELSRSGHHSFPPQNGNQECLPHRNQRWVHFPVTICEALRTFGADWNCFLPCRSSCMSSKEEKSVTAGAGSDGGSSCGAVIARWLVAVQEGEGKGRREIELVVGGEEIPAAETKERSRSQRRHIFEELEFNEEEICRERKEAEEEEEQGRVSICIPPKNALLLMRCRSDPVKMAALANKFCGSPVQKDEKEEDKDYEDCQEDSVGDKKMAEEVKVEQEADEDSEVEVSEERWVTAQASEEQRTVEAESSSVIAEEEEGGEQEVDQETNAKLPEESVDNSEEPEEEERLEVLSGPVIEAHVDHENERNHGGEDEEEAGAASAELLAENDEDGVDFDDEVGPRQSKSELDVEEADDGVTEILVSEKVAPELEEAVQETVGEERSEPENPEPDDFSPAKETKGRDSVERETSVLPECLLLMMCEPKLSMEVSKETWVCSTDFIRWLPERHVNKAAVGGEDPKKRTALAAPESKRSGSALTAQQARILHQPPRSSCSFPSQAAAVTAGVARRGGESMAAMIEQKLLNAKAGEPLVLPRCKSEPRRTAMKLAPDACFWKNRKLEPHRRSANLRVKAAGVGV
ncbi:hypothetical protein CDL15_Pgr002395 [Punica granatum]|nr:hypothetical protein CDL15_Pgr002395 [Punica granatum]